MNDFPKDAIAKVIAAWKTKKFSLEVIVALGQVIAWAAAALKPTVASNGAVDATPELSLVETPTSDEAIAKLEALLAGHNAGTLAALGPGVGKALLSWLLQAALKWAMNGAIA